ncbi:Putative flavodoxin oxidoreductase [gamma proteobacterium HdN1]|nr:Putative flavodoxin oxidoreductase [gamma proteobacterium HdN1]
METHSGLRHTTTRIRHWFRDAVFTDRTASDYFAPFFQAIDPDWVPGGTVATLERIYTETADTKTFILRPENGWKGFQAGQHVSLSVQVNGRYLVRTFTIASTPHRFRTTGTLALTVKRNPDGRLSNYLHDEMRIGARVNISPSAGEFLLPADLEHTLLYLVAGSGITPAMSHIRQLVEEGFTMPVTVLYYARSKDEHIFLPELRAIAKASPRLRLLVANTREAGGRASLQGRICLSHMEKALENRKPTQIYICGPRGFEVNAKSMLESVDLNEIAITTESFGGLALPASNRENPSSHPLRLLNSSQILDASTGKTLLETAEQAGLNPPSGCRMGICHTCKCRKTEGRVRNLLTGEISDAGEDIIQLCISVPETEITLDL